MLHDGSRKLVRDLEIGDRVKTLNENGELIDTDVIMMMDISNQESKLKFLYVARVAEVKADRFSLPALKRSSSTSQPTRTRTCASRPPT